LSLRAFIAVDIEDEAILARIKGLQARLVATDGILKLVEPGNIHITLWFLGNITPFRAERIYEGMKSISFRPFKIELTGVGAFPRPTRPRVIWIGIGRGSEELRAIYEQLKDILRPLGFKPDPKGFTPHVTVARVKRHGPELVKAIMDCSTEHFGTFEAREIRLKKSVLTPRGPIYSTLYSVQAGANVGLR